jgi:hypothetical protein
MATQYLISWEVEVIKCSNDMYCIYEGNCECDKNIMPVLPQ